MMAFAPESTLSLGAGGVGERAQQVSVLSADSSDEGLWFPPRARPAPALKTGCNCYIGYPRT